MSAAKAVKEDVAKVRDQQCKEAKDRYEKAIAARRIYKARHLATRPRRTPISRKTGSTCPTKKRMPIG